MRAPHAFLALAAGLALGSGVAAAEAPPGATACSGCHGAASALPAISGRPAAEIVGAMEAFRSGTRQATVMDRIVKGFSPDEVKSIASYLESAK